jgi:outer membrane protein assembly factor BamA
MSKFFPRHHSLMIRVAGMYTPELISSIYGGSTESQVFASDSVLPQYIMRGYTRGQIYGRNIANANIEYRFPIYRIEEGSGTYALFFHNMVGALVADGITVDGRFINEDAGIYEAVSLGKQSFWSAGAEVKLETTLGYTFPFNLIVGTYAAFNQPTGVEYSLGTRFQFSLF